MSTNPLIGYLHQHSIGIRTLNLLISLSTAANSTARAIAEQVDINLIESAIAPDDEAALTDFRSHLLPAIVGHQHTASAFLIAAGNEKLSAIEVVTELRTLNPLIEYLVVSDGPGEEFAVMIGIGAAKDFAMQSLPGLAELSEPNLVIAFSEQPPCLDELLDKLSEVGIGATCHEFSTHPYPQLQQWSLDGAHAILAFTPSDRYPVGTLLTPVINVASNSDFHASVIGDFDLHTSSTVEEIVAEVVGTFNRERSFSEYTRTVLPIAAPLENLVIALNPALTNLARDLQKNFDVASPIVLTSGSSDELALLNDFPSSTAVFNLSECGSLVGLAAKVAETIKTPAAPPL